MWVYLSAGLAVVISLVAHLVIWRIRVPRSPTVTLLLIFVASGILVGLGWYLGIGDRRPSTPTMADFIGYWLAILATATAYACLYSAVEVDSPSLAIVKIILAAGPRGIETQALEKKFFELGFIRSRISHMVEDSFLTIRDETLFLKRPGRWLLTILDIYPNVVGRKKVGG